MPCSYFFFFFRVCPVFKLYWMEGDQVVAIKRHDHDKPYVLPHHIFGVVKHVFPSFKIGEHRVKFKGGFCLRLKQLKKETVQT